jgi:hypothetical protein
MWRAKRAFRSMKSVLRMEPVYHRADRRIETDHAAIFRVKRLEDSERQIWNSCGLAPPPKTLQVTT